MSFKLDHPAVNGNGQPAIGEFVPAAAQAPARFSPLKMVSEVLGTFSMLDRFVILLALLTAVLVVLYLSLS